MAQELDPNDAELKKATPFIALFVMFTLALFALFVIIVLIMVGIVEI